ncbi:hypothetical protein T03_1121 [Trichinella britovi]|uniref:Uncharacterized protein n=1 Tax=Trichinella britovi TaxID=45882 RepID=A0A0V1DFM7_TRIBR|nr:hypothetical protein T03_1121 [Trichinella britovi]
MTFPEPIPIHGYCIPHFEGQDTSFAMLVWVDGYRPVDGENNTDDNPLIGDTWLGDLGVDATVAPKRPGVKSPLDRIADAGAVRNYIIAGCRPQDEIGNRRG